MQTPTDNKNVNYFCQITFFFKLETLLFGFAIFDFPIILTQEAFLIHDGVLPVARKSFENPFNRIVSASTERFPAETWK